jgi:predicted nucleic acid-binding protein
MPYLLDTCVVSELRKPGINPGVLSWISSIDPNEAFLSVLTIGEIRSGIELHRLRNPMGAGNLERWLLGLETHYAERILPITAKVADRWGRLSPSQPLPAVDGMIAATGLEYQLIVVTRNISDFQRSGVNTLNPYSEIVTDQ